MCPRQIEVSSTSQQDNAACWEKLFQQLPVALAHAVLSMLANSALKPEAPRTFTFGSMKPYDVTPTTALRVRLRKPFGAALAGSPKFWTHGPPLETPALALPYSNSVLLGAVLPTGRSRESLTR